MQSIIEKYSTPFSVLLGALVIGGAIYWSDGNPQVANRPAAQGPDSAAVQKALQNVDPVMAEDHVRGNPNADIVIVEYSDTECPFCKRFHDTMRTVMDEYESTGEVAWVYRHFPLDSLHKKARAEAVALECANEQGGNDAFWKYADRLYEITPSNDGLDSAELPKIAAFVGLDTNAFASCLTSGRHDARIEANVQNALETGGQGTPWSIVITKDGTKFPLSGAQPFESVKLLIETARKVK